MTTVSQAKNAMARAISCIVDPALTRGEKDALWEHFEGRCAFCDTQIEQASRTGHLDHLESGRGNGPGNRVLACARCNGDEKRDRSWKTFLREKCSDDAEFDARVARVEEWCVRHPTREVELSPEAQEALHEAQQLTERFHQACSRLRASLRDRPSG